MPYALRKAPKRDLYWVINKQTKQKYSKDPLPRSRAEAQRRALYAAESRGELEGEGWLSDAFGAVKKAATTVVQRVVDVSKGKREGYSPKVRAYLAANGNKTIAGLTLRRDPIRSVLHTAINAITLGRWGAARKKYAYDKVFHLGLEVKLDGGPTTIVEKNEVINVGPSKPADSDTEVMVLNDPGTLTLQQMLDNAQKLMGGRFFPYSAFENNCQDFIIAILRANNLWTAARDQFVKQPLEQVINELPSYTGRLANVATDLAAVADVAIQGRGKRREAAAFLRSLRGGGFESANFFGALSRGATPTQAFGAVQKAANPIIARHQQISEEGKERLRKATEVPPALKGFLDTMDVAADVMENLPVVGNFVKGVKAVRDVTMSALEGSGLMTKDQYDAYLARLPADAPRRPYDKYVADYQGVQKARATDKAAGPAVRCPADRIYNPEKEYAYGDNVCVEGPDGPRYIEIPDPNDPKETCVVGPPNGPKRWMGVMRKSECEKIQEEGMARYEAARQANMSGTDKFFDGLMKGLTTIGDIGAEAISNIPGIGKIAANVYQQFAPPGSAYYQPDKGTGEKIVDTVRGIVGLGKGETITMPLAVYKKEHAHLIRLLRKYKKADLLKEAADQEAEVKRVTGGGSDDAFLREARKAAKKAKLNWQSLRLSDKAGKKLMITAPDGRVIHFGAKGMGDYIHYRLAGDPTADQHRQRYRARATKIRGDWAKDPYSPNSLAIAVLW